MRPGVRTWLAGALSAAVAGGLAACGGSGPGPAASTHTTASVPVTSTTAPAPTASVTTTTDTTGTTIPVGTTATTVTAPTTTTLPGAGTPTVLLGDMNTPEQFIIGQLYADALTAEGYQVDVNRNIGATTVSEAAMSQGSLDVFPEYLNTYDQQVAGDDTQYATLTQALAAGQAYAATHGQTLLDPTPFSDTSGIVVLTSFARAHHLHTMADLSRVQDELTLGSPLEFSAEPQEGLPALEQAYGFTPAVTSVVTIGTQYRALVANEIQAAYDQTTDWQLSEPIYTDLPDTQHVLGFGNVVPVVSTNVLAAEGPDFAATINRVDALLTTRAIRGMTAEMNDATLPATAAAEVAKEFLQGNGILPPPSWSTVTTTTTTPSTLSIPSAPDTTSTTGTVNTPARKRTRGAERARSKKRASRP